MIGQIFQSRYRVEAALAEGQSWQSWTVRDIINIRPACCSPILPIPKDARSIDGAWPGACLVIVRSSVSESPRFAWALRAAV